MQGTNKGFLLGGSVRSVVAACFVVGAIGWAAPQAAEPQAASAPAAVRSQSAAAPLAAIDQYCVTCHNQRTQTGGLSLDGLDESTIPADVWEKVLRKLRTGAMPPQGVRRPDRATYDRLITSIESALDMSPVLMERYLVAADAIGTLAICDREALHRVAAESIMRFLGAAGADTSVGNKLGKTPLDVAMDRKDRNGRCDTQTPSQPFVS